MLPLFGSIINRSELESPYFAGQAEKVYESCRIFMVIELSCCKACYIRIIQGIGRSSSRLDYISLIKSEPDLSGNIFLCTLNKGLYRFPERGEPFPFIDDLGKL